MSTMNRSSTQTLQKLFQARGISVREFKKTKKKKLNNKHKLKPTDYNFISYANIRICIIRIIRKYKDTIYVFFSFSPFL